uniref:Uncharacterized protein n=1 Tax=Virus NIOZ-UU157 TaxID=2763269 RepID=A0A7S9XGV0_9VIRU|nr:MAG: hypothetical protein NIOZUU157_00330 [Virus NIOZ-UU157]|tara:strand:- start:231 stop:560 length:330 start_codon:yes stop_codon:yes gene_type:complete
MRTSKEFNETYELVCKGDGLSINVPSVVQFLNLAFSDFLKIKGFEYKEISTIRGIPRMDTNLPDLMPYVGRIIQLELEDKISMLLKVEFEVEERLRSLSLDKHGKPITI